MDSTFLGILAGAGIELLNGEVKGELVLIHLDQKNLDTVESLGLDLVLRVDRSQASALSPRSYQALDETEKSDKSQAQMALDAHKNLIKANKANRRKFQDVIQFLEDRADG